MVRIQTAYRLCTVLVLSTMIVGCEAIPQAGLDLEDGMYRSLHAYKAGAYKAVEVLLGAYAKEHDKRNLLTAEMNIHEQEMELEGKGDDPQDSYRVVDSSIALEIVGQFKVDRDSRDKEIAEFRAGWAKASKNFSNAVRLRNELRRFLEMEGVQPEQIKAMADGIAQAIEEGM